MARAQQKRLDRARDDLAALESFRPAAIQGRAAMGAVIEVEDGEEGRTLFLCPVGAGIELTMPGGDGFLTVVTPASPLGRAILGRRVGESVEVVVEGEPKEWTLTWVG
jgi:transcription elongation GreA/GreB family factor